MMHITLLLPPGGDQPFEVSREEFHSKKLVNKLVQQIHDPLVVASGALPEWCHALTSTHPHLFPFEVREVFFACTAFGTSRLVGMCGTCLWYVYMCVVWVCVTELGK